MSRSIKVRLIATRYPHFGRHAGIGQFARHLPALGFSVDSHLVPDDDSALPLPIPALRDRLRARLRRSGMAWYKLSDLAAELRALGAALAGRAQIIHFLDGEHGVQFLPRWLRHVPRRRRPVLVANFHQPASMLPDLVDRAVVRELDAVVLVADSQRAFFTGLLPPERIVTILHGVDTEHFRPSAAPGDGILRCVSAGHWLRDWDAMLEIARAFADDPQVEFHIVTGRPTGLEDLPIVRFHRDLSDDALARLYADCDIGLLPLIDSTANNSLLEFLASGLPLVTTALPSVADYVGQGSALLVAPGDRSGLIAAVRALSADGRLRARMGAAARRRAQELAWPRIASQYAQLYRELLARPELRTT